MNHLLYIITLVCAVLLPMFVVNGDTYHAVIFSILAGVNLVMMLMEAMILVDHRT